MVVMAIGMSMAVGALVGSAEPPVVVRCEPAIDRAVELAVADLRACRSPHAFYPDARRHYDGVWLTDSVFAADGYRYAGADCAARLRYVADRFRAVQEPDGNVPMVLWGAEGTVDYGGRYDLAQGRKQNRDMESAYTFVHAHYVLWREYGDTAAMRAALDPMRRALDSLERRRDPATGLILATYGPPNSDVAVDHALPMTTAHVYFNAVYVAAYREFAEMAAAARDRATARTYRDRGRHLRAAMNRQLWRADHGRYEPLIVRTPVTTDTGIGAHGIAEDRRFPVIDNLMAIYHGVPALPAQTAQILRGLDESEAGLRLRGRMVWPLYPDGFFTHERLFDNGSYHNGDVWTWFSNRLPIVLCAQGDGERARDMLRRQAEVALRDGGFAEYYEDDAAGAARGAVHYAGTASSFLQAVVEGLFGVRVDRPSHRIAVAPSYDGDCELRCLAGGEPFRLRQRVGRRRSERRLEVETSLPGYLDVRVRAPGALSGVRVTDGAGHALPSVTMSDAAGACVQLCVLHTGGKATFVVRWETHAGG